MAEEALDLARIEHEIQPWQEQISHTGWPTGSCASSSAPVQPTWCGATVAEPAVFTVSWHHGSEWVRIVHVPGLRADGRCPEIVHRAWVPRRAVSLQGERTMHGGVPAVLLGIE